MYDTNDRPGLEERYLGAANGRNLTVGENIQGSMRSLIASGIATREDPAKPLRPAGKPTIRLGHALARLQSQWHGIEHPVRKLPKSIRQWMDDLPLKKIGERTVRDSSGQEVVKPILTRDRDGARVKHEEERNRLDRIYRMELLFLAQKLPARAQVCEALFLAAVTWGWDDPESGVAEVLQHWLDETCKTCEGTGEVMAGEKVRICGVCEGRQKAPVPRGYEGRRLYALIEESKGLWLQAVKQHARALRD